MGTSPLLGLFVRWGLFDPSERTLSGHDERALMLRQCNGGRGSAANFSALCFCGHTGPGDSLHPHLGPHATYCKTTIKRHTRAVGARPCQTREALPEERIGRPPAARTVSRRICWFSCRGTHGDTQIAGDQLLLPAMRVS